MQVDCIQRESQLVNFRLTLSVELLCFCSCFSIECDQDGNWSSVS